MPSNPLGFQPKIRDGVRGEGLVTMSAAGPDQYKSGPRFEDIGYTGGFRRFSATTPVVNLSRSMGITYIKQGIRHAGARLPLIGCRRGYRRDRA